jgi:hypothetical protein
VTLGTHLHFWRSWTGPYFVPLAQMNRCPEFQTGGIAYSDDDAATCWVYEWPPSDGSPLGLHRQSGGTGHGRDRLKRHIVARLGGLFRFNADAVGYGVTIGKGPLRRTQDQCVSPQAASLRNTLTPASRALLSVEAASA